MKIALLLTATVRPQVKGSSFSVEERREMYRSTLQYYAKEIGRKYPIVLVENSDADLSPWEREFKDSLQLEILQFTPPQLRKSQDGSTPEDYGFDNSKGKGYNEYLMIKLALEQSETLRSCTHFLKITGRYPMLNIREMIREMEKRGKDKVMMLDVKEFKLYEKLQGSSCVADRWGDSRFFLMSVDFYRKHLMDCYKEMNAYIWRKWAENYLYELSVKYRRDKACSFRFSHQVQFGGQSGVADYVEYYNSLKNHCKNKVRRVLRILFPNVWF